MRYKYILLVLLSIAVTTFTADCFAAALPGPANADRVKPEQKLPDLNRKSDSSASSPEGISAMPIPEDTKNITLTLKKLEIEGNTTFSDENLKDLYAQYLGQTITLDKVYMVAGAITERYRNAGYFLSLAYVPPQDIENGTAKIKVVEGYIGSVDIDQSMREHWVIQKYAKDLMTSKPVKAKQLESFLLRLNDLPGYSFKGILSSLENAQEGAVKLSLAHTDKAGKGSINIDNYSSRFLGPHEISATYSDSFIPLHQTTISGLTTLPVDELNYITASHSVVIAPDLTLDINGSFTNAEPGYTLDQFDVETISSYVGLSLNYQWIRQRDENLALKLTVDGRNSNTDLQGGPFTRDRIRAVRANATYDVTDNWQGYNFMNVTLSQGIDGLGSSDKDYLYLSRAEAVPDFTKIEFAFARLQALSSEWSVLMTTNGQYSDDSLFSAEEFGYGGQPIGRAFDSSEIIGDNGLSGALELRYTGWSDMEPFAFQPYSFYDIGRVWNYDSGQPERESASSAGFGLKTFTPEGFSGNIGLSWPLTNDISAPIYGQSKKGPRLLVQFSQEF